MSRTRSILGITAGVCALVGSDRDPFFLPFIVPGLPLLVASWGGDAARA